MTSCKTLLTLGLLLASAAAPAQEYRPGSSLFLTPWPVAQVTVPFSLSATGTQLPVRWGLDVAWLNEQNIRKGINFIGRENLGIARSSFQMNESLVGDTTLTKAQQTMLRRRTAAINLISHSLDIVLNADQGDGSSQYINSYYSSGNRANPERWARLIDASVAYMQEKYPAHKVVAVSPFNEPDYTPWNEGTLANFKEIAKLLKENYPRFENIAITAGNTLNNDYAANWYNGVKPYATWGNTHQLAGSFNSFANFWKQVVDDGNYPYADELHNVGEAMIAVHYGMKTGIWWGFDSRARGEFCRISNHGTRLAYTENRATWTAASVYRDDATGQAKAFVGGSERQANNSTYLFLSPDRDVYFDGQGPLRAFRMEYPGGTGYQTGQTNAERVYNITSGEDVERKPLTAGEYKIMNKGTQGLVAALGTDDIVQNCYTPTATPRKQDIWAIAPASDRIGGDYSFYTITNPTTGLHLNVLNNSTESGANVIPYNAQNASNEQWYTEYAGDGFYFIRNRESGLYLSLRANRKVSNISIVQSSLLTGANLDRQLWRFLPIDAPTELTAPTTPTGLTGTPQSASVRLNWTASTDADVDNYTVLRANADGNGWNTIARGIAATTYTDNTCRPGTTYIYKVVAVDKSLNASEPSTTIQARPGNDKDMVASWQFEGSINDESANMMDAVSPEAPAYQTDAKVGAQALALNGTGWLQLPYEAGDMDEMTIALWAKWTNNSKSWTRLFDFGNGTTQYMFLTPSNGTNMRFAIKDGGDEQTVDAPTKFPANSWHHVAVTLGGGTVTLWLDGQAVGSSTGVTIKPSDIRPVLNYLGRSQFRTDPLFAGALDDVRIYNHALSQELLRDLISQPTGIASPEAEESRKAEPLYNLGGSRVPESYKGVAVQKGRKVVRR